MLLDLLRFLRGRSLARIKAGFRASGRPTTAAGDLERLEKAVREDPGPHAFNDLGIALQGAGRLEEALSAYDKAIALDPAFAAAYFNRGNAQGDLKRHEAALESYEHAIALNPGSADAHIGRGNAFSELGRHESALGSYARAIELRPDYAEAHFNHGIALRELNRTEAALASFEQAMQLKPDQEYLYGLWLFMKMAVCDWRDIEKDFSTLFDKIERGEKASPPFPLVAMPCPPALQRKAAESWTLARYPRNHALPAILPRAASGKIRIGYFSADFHDHATSRLMAELFELHDRSRFELTAFSLGVTKDDAMMRRVSAAFERFIDICGITDLEAASRARDLGIDIAVDLKGFTQESRTGIFALRAAPVQVNYLGYPGTMGAGYIDYLLADATLVPESHRQFYAEKIACLPNSYQPNDTRRPLSGRVPTREDEGLPSAGFVFCCFNNNFKILPAMFDCWMRILRRVEGSILWLLEDNPRALANLRQEASARGVNPGRLVFAPRANLAAHLARHKLADLFLDTLPCNAHTTASDALWMGLPVLTCIGDAFAGRVAASLLNAIGLPGLVAPDLRSYEELAISLAKDPARLGEIRRALEVGRSGSPLFDTTLYARHLEAAYTTMHERNIAGLPPDHFHVTPLPRA